MLNLQRKQKILEMLEQDRAIQVSELRRLLQVSEASIRRDLNDLERAGFLRRTYGGAVANQSAVFEPSLAEKEDRYRTEKQAIAAAAVQCIQGGETILLDAGSTTQQIARQLKQRRAIKDLTVVTNGFNVAWELARSPIEVILLGGNLRHNTLSFVGPITEDVLAGLQADKLFLGANGVDLKKGVSTPNLLEARTKKAMLASAKEVFVVADHSKFGQVTFSHVCRLEQVHCFITDRGIPEDLLPALQKRGLKVLVAA